MLAAHERRGFRRVHGASLLATLLALALGGFRCSGLWTPSLLYHSFVHWGASSYRLQLQHHPGSRSDRGVARFAAPAAPASVTIEKKMTDLDERVRAVEKPEDEKYWRVLAYCTACRTPWCKLPWRKNTCLKGDAKAEGSRGNRCDMSFEDYTDILVKSVPLLSRQKGQVLTRECWRAGDSDPSGIGTVTVAIVPRPAAEGYCSNLGQNGIQCSVVPDSFFRGGPSD